MAYSERVNDPLEPAALRARVEQQIRRYDLIHPGAAVFFDAGRAWFIDAPVDKYQRFFQRADGRVLRDVGLGLRLGSSRSSRGAVVHLDVAFPLDRSDASLKAVQWLVSTRDTF